MVRKVALVIGLFLVVDRVMYHKLGKNSQKEQYALSSVSKPSLHEVATRKKGKRERIVAHAKQFFATDRYVNFRLLS